MSRYTKHNLKSLAYALLNTVIMLCFAMLISMVILGITPQELINNL
jgi:hypothetical protein